MDTNSNISINTMTREAVGLKAVKLEIFKLLTSNMKQHNTSTITNQISYLLAQCNLLKLHSSNVSGTQCIHNREISLKTWEPESEIMLS